MTEPKDGAQNPLRTMAEEFLKRDEVAVSNFNAQIEQYGLTIEARLAFVEGRLFDAAGLLYRALKEIADRESDSRGG